MHSKIFEFDQNPVEYEVGILNLIFGIFYFRDVAQPGSVLAWGARGRKFKSCHPDQLNLDLLRSRFFYFSNLKINVLS